MLNPPRLLAMVVAAFLAGSVLAFIPHLSNEPCSTEASHLPVASVRYDVAYGGWPLRYRCTFADTPATVRVRDVGPGIPLSLLMIALCAAVFTRSWRGGLVLGVGCLAFATASVYSFFEIQGGLFIALVAVIAAGFIARRARDALLAGVLTFAGVSAWFL